MAAITDKFGKASIDTDYAIATTVKTTRVPGATVVEAFDLSKFSDDTPVFFVTYKKTTDPVTNITSVTNLVSWKGLVNTGANTLTNLELAPGYADTGNAIGDFIECIPTSHWANSLIEGIFVSHNPDGTLKNKIATLAKINGGSTAGVLTTDTSGNVAAKSSLVAYATTGVVQGGISGSDLTGLSITFTADGTTKYRIRGSVNVYQNSTNNYAELVIKEGATLIGISNTPLTVGTQRATVTAESIITPSAGSHTYKLFLAFYVGVGETIPSGNTPYIYAEALR